MIHVKDPYGDEYILSWVNGEYRDEAGHVWNMNAQTGDLSSVKHGHYSQHSYKVVPMEQETKR